MKYLVSILICLFFLVDGISQIQFKLSLAYDSDSSKVTVHAVNMGKDSATIIGFNFPFYYDTLEAKLTRLDFSPLSKRSWKLVTLESDTTLTHEKAKIATNMRHELFLFDENAKGADLAPQEEMSLFHVVFDNNPGTSDNGGSVYFPGSKEEMGKFSLVYVDKKIKGHPVINQTGIVLLSDPNKR